MKSKARRWLSPGLFEYSVKLGIKYKLLRFVMHCGTLRPVACLIALVGFPVW